MTDASIPTVIGWKEVVALPELGFAALKVKTDTGARTSALHAHVLDTMTRDGVDYVRFEVLDKTGQPKSQHELPVFAIRRIKNTSGVAERRFAIETPMILGSQRWTIQLTLADRRSMKYDMILGRRAMRTRGILVDPSQTYLAGRPDLVAAKV